MPIPETIAALKSACGVSERDEQVAGAFVDCRPFDGSPSVKLRIQRGPDGYLHTEPFARAGRFVCYYRRDDVVILIGTFDPEEGSTLRFRLPEARS